MSSDKSKASKQNRTKWSKKERQAIEKYLLPKVEFNRKPPTKTEVLKAQAIEQRVIRKELESNKVPSMGYS